MIFRKQIKRSQVKIKQIKNTMAKKTIKVEVPKVTYNQFLDKTYIQNKIAYFEKRKSNARTPKELQEMTDWVVDFRKKLADLNK